MNVLKTGFLMIILTFILVMAGGLVGGMGGLIFALVLSLAMNLGAYWFSDKIALAMTGAKEVSSEDDRELHYLVEEQATLAGRPKPRVYVIQSDSPNAFATGRNPSHAAVAVTTGIRRILSRQELGGVLAHEMAHVGNRDTLIMALVAAMAGAVTYLAHMAQFAMFFGGMGGGRRSDDRGGGNMVGMIALVVVAVALPIAALLIRLAISRAREYQADTTGARTSGTPWALADALEKLEKGSRTRPLKVNEAVSHLFIVNPLSGGTVASLFSTHPPLQKRVERLRSM